MREQEVWTTVPTEQPYGSLDALLQAEIGYTREEAKRELLAESHPKRGPKDNSVKLTELSRDKRAQQNGVGRVTQYKLDYLAGYDKKHATSYLPQVQAGALSTHAAYQKARGVPKETPLTTLHRAWRQVPAEDRLRFLVEMLTPQERRALLFGMEDPTHSED